MLDAFAATPTPTISGTAAVGHKLTASVGGSWAPEATLKIQWKSNGTYAGDGSTTDVLTKADGGAAITVTVTATRPSYATTSQTSAPTAHVTGGILVMPSFSIYGYSYKVDGYVTVTVPLTKPYVPDVSMTSAPTPVIQT